MNISKWLITFLTVVVASCAGANTPSTDVSWTAEYLGDVLPENDSPAWTVADNWGYTDPHHGGAGSDGDVLSIWTDDCGGVKSWSLGPASWSGDTDSTVEFRIRVPAVVAGQTYAAQLFFGFPRGANADRRWTLFFGPDRVGSTGDGSEPAYLVNLTEWHTFRAILINTSTEYPGGYLAVYDLDSQDAAPVIFDTVADAVTSDEIQYGDLFSGSIGGRAELDYLVWTNAGAFAPAAAAFSAQPPSTDVTWSGQYLAQALPEQAPSSPLWTESHNWGYDDPHGDAVITQDNEVLDFWTDSAGGTKIWEIDNPASWSGDTDSTVEFRVRCTSTVTGQKHALQFSFGFPRGTNADRRWMLAVGPDQISDISGSDPNYAPDYAVNLRGWHRFRVLLYAATDDYPGGALELYDLDSLTPKTPVMLDTVPDAVTATAFEFGDLFSSAVGGHVELDYLAWTNAGAFLPEYESCDQLWAAGLGHPADANHDCYFNLEDFAIIAQNWMTCNDPAHPENCTQNW